MKKLLCVLLSLLLIAGCTPKAENVSAESQYDVSNYTQETDTDEEKTRLLAQELFAKIKYSGENYYAHECGENSFISSSIQSFFIADTLFFLTSDSKIYTSALDGSNQEDITPSIAQDQAICAMGTDGVHLIASVLRYESVDNTISYTEERLLTMDLHGNVESEIKLPDPNERSRAVAITPEGAYFVAYSTSCRFYSNSGELLKEVSNCHGADFIRLPDNRLLIFYTSFSAESYEQPAKHLQEVDTAQHSLGKEYELPVGMEVTRVNCDSAGTLYLQNSSDSNHIWPEGVYTIDSDTITLLFSWEDLGLDTYQYMMAPYGVNRMLSIALDPSTYETSALFIDQVESTVPEDAVQENTIITLACWEKSIPLNLLVNQFNEQQSSYCIEIKEYFNENDPKGSYQRMLAELSTGNGADLYYLQGLNESDLRSSGLLTDIKQLMNSDPEFQAADYYQEILKCWEEDGALYEIAPYFGINGLIGAQSMLKGRTNWTWKDFQDFCAALDDDVIAVRGLTQEELLRWVNSYALNDFVNSEEGTCSFDSDAFISLLQFAKTMPVEEELLEDIDIAQGRCALLPWGLSSVQDYAYYARLYPAGFSFIGFPANAGGACAVCADTFGLGTSENAYTGGWAFLKFLLSDEPQVEIWGEMGWPISKSAMETLLEDAQLPVENEDSPFYGLENAHPLTANDSARIQEYIKMVNKVYNSDETILTIMEEETKPFFSGEKSANAVAGIIQNRVGIYLAEQS